MASTSYEVCPHKGDVSLEVVDGGQVLVHRLISEHVRCPPAHGPWRLAFDEEGSAYISSQGSDAKWVDEMFAATLCPHPRTSDLWVLASEAGEQPKRLADWMTCALTDLKAKVKLFPAGCIEVDVVKMCVGTQGFFVGWDLGSFHGALGLSGEKGQAGKWTRRGWERWAKFLSNEVSLPGGHLRQKTPASDATLVGSHLAAMEDGAEFRLVSTHALVALCSRWASKHRKDSLRAGDDQAAVASFLHGFMNSASEALGAHEWTVFLCMGPKWGPPSLPTGDAPLVLTLSGWIRSIFECRSGFARALCAVLAPLCTVGFVVSVAGVLLHL